MTGYVLHQNGQLAHTTAVYMPLEPEDAQAESSSEELLEEDDEPIFCQQPPPTDSRAFMSSIWKCMKKIFKGQIRLKKADGGADYSFGTNLRRVCRGS